MSIDPNHCDDCAEVFGYQSRIHELERELGAMVLRCNFCNGKGRINDGRGDPCNFCGPSRAVLGLAYPNISQEDDRGR